VCEPTATAAVNVELPTVNVPPLVLPVCVREMVADPTATGVT
jgi:hypothetical protein